MLNSIKIIGLIIENPRKKKKLELKNLEHKKKSFVGGIPSAHRSYFGLTPLTFAVGEKLQKPHWNPSNIHTFSGAVGVFDGLQGGVSLGKSPKLSEMPPGKASEK